LQQERREPVLPIVKETQGGGAGTFLVSDAPDDGRRCGSPSYRG